MCNDLQQKKRQELLETYKRELDIAMRSNSEKFDKYLIICSTGGLALSVSFLKNLLSSALIFNICFLYISWFCFCITIASTIISLLISQEALKKSWEYAKKYYRDNDNEYFDKTSCFDSIAIGLNWLSGVMFFLGVLLTLVFVVINS